MRRTRQIAALVAAAAAMMLASQWALGDGGRGGSKLPKKWIYGPAFNAPSPVPIWNPAKKRMLAGLLTNGGTIGGPTTNYCTVAGRTGEGASDFTWTEMQHSPIDWNQAWTFWALPCATDLVRERGVVPGIRAAYTNVREIQKAVDGGAMVVVLPTLDSVQEAKDAVQMAYYPPIGKRKYGPGQWQTLYANVPGGYRQTFNDNFVLWVMIETIEGSKAAYEIAQVPGIHAVFGATGDLGNFSGFNNGQNDYDSLISHSHNAAHAAGKRACTAFGQRNRPGHTFTCTQN
ncbi:MAG TPA: aldolase/citrate lyase family protein [Burkholderiales bacterium]|nr:aldolase/citrate lyase family protein [Burkholderiales bacterium]